MKGMDSLPDSVDDSPKRLRVPPAYVPTKDGFDLEWRGGKIHLRIAITREGNHAWIDYTSTGEFISGPLDEKTSEVLDALAIIESPAL
jgi:hypothetical protein